MTFSDSAAYGITTDEMVGATMQQVTPVLSDDHVAIHTKESAEKVAVTIKGYANQIVTSTDKVIEELIAFMQEKGFEAFGWKNKYRTRFFEEYLKETQLTYEYFCYLYACAEFAIEHKLSYSDILSKSIRAVCQAAKKNRNEIWSEALKVSQNDIPDVAEIKKLIDLKRKNKSSDIKAPRSKLGDSLSPNIKIVMEKINNAPGERDEYIHKVRKLIEVAESDPTNISRLGYDELRQLKQYLESEPFGGGCVNS